MKVTFCLLVTNWIVSINTKENKVNGAKFATENGKRIAVTEYYTHEFCATKVLCAMMCTSEEKCCDASYNHATSIFRLDTSENCCVTIETYDGWAVIKKDRYGILIFTDNNEIANLTKLNNSCVCLGGQFLEAETAEENTFLKSELLKRNATIDGYWLGGYNVNKDGSFEWISNPGQSMTYSDMNPVQPNNPTKQRRLVYWREYEYAWGDAFCNAKLPYVCEFSKNE